MPGPVLVTGASGFVGARLCAELLARGASVRAPLRRPGALAPRTGLETFAIEDLASSPIDPKWLAGVDAVMHLAGFAHRFKGDPGADADSIRRINVEATEVLARAAAKARVRRFVYASSIKVNGEDSGTGSFSAGDTPGPRDEYGRSKLAAETILRRLAGECGMEIVIVRPPLVYGPGVKANFLRLLEAVDRGLPLPLAGLQNRRSLVHVGNLADALIACACRSAAAGKTYLVCDGEDVSTAELISRIAAALGRQARLFPFPLALLRLAARGAGKLPEIERLTGNLVLDGGPIRKDLLWRPPFTLQQGLAETAAWFRSRQKGNAP
ncbi:MAG: NAD-dependent epimerase/dehydratase family protein [Betaproteobacteria bacterium]|nr:NAD-dependent epimerase/dehydratase family protein [Betaproteobacteria bacterium]